MIPSTLVLRLGAKINVLIIALVIENLTRLKTWLDYLKLKYVKSSTNFVFFESKKHIDILSKEMLDKGVIVGRPFPPFYDWCRISTGTSEEVDKFINGMLEVYS